MYRSILRGFIKSPAKEGEAAPLLTGSKRSGFLMDNDDPGSVAKEFIDHPERFRPTDHAVRQAYAEFVVRPTGEYCWAEDVGTEFPILTGEMRNVEVTVDYTYTDLTRRIVPTNILQAEVKDSNGGWKKRTSRGVAFVLEEWVQKLDEEDIESFAKRRID